MNPDDRFRGRSLMACRWDTPEYWAKERATTKLREARERFAPRRQGRDKKNKIARQSRKRNHK